MATKNVTILNTRRNALRVASSVIAGNSTGVVDLLDHNVQRDLRNNPNSWVIEADNPDTTGVNAASTITAYNATGGTLTQDTLVYLSGVDATSGYPKLVKADADAGSAPAQFFVTADIANNASGSVAARGLSAATLNTNAATVGDPVYLNTTAGGWTLTEQGGTGTLDQTVGYVIVKSATVGQILWEVGKVNKVGSNEIQNGAVTASKLGTGAAASNATTYDGSGHGLPLVDKVALGAVDTGGGVLVWVAPFDCDVSLVTVDVTTKSTAACTVDIGSTATSATTSSNNLLTGLDVGTAAGTFNNIDDKGASGKSHQRVAAGDWVTGSMASGAAAGLVGNAYIHYTAI